MVGVAWPSPAWENYRLRVLTTEPSVPIIQQNAWGGSVHTMLTVAGSDRRAERLGMVEEQLRARGVRHERVLHAMSELPRQEFVAEPYRFAAYEDRPLPIGYGQTVSQPYMVAVMTVALRLGPEDRVLEVGTGSGYQAAVLAQLVREVVTFEWVPELAERARATLQRLGVEGVEGRVGDGSLSAGGEPFDGIIVTAGAAEIPPPLVDQLAPGGRLVMPVGSPRRQILTVVHRTTGGLREEQREDCVFVPLQGAYGWT